MEGSSESERSKLYPSQENYEEDEEMSSDHHQEENITNIGRGKTVMVRDGSGSSSINSTIEENDEKKSSVRPYIRSKTPRLRWTQDLHLRFVQAVERLGGQERATPKMVLQLMNIKGLNIAHIKSHLQMYRSKKIDDPSQVISDYRNFVNGMDRNIYNLSQIPMLQSYNQKYNSACPLRYGDAPLYMGLDKRIQSSFMSRTTIDNVRPIFYSSVAERIFGRNSTNSNVHIDLSSPSELQIHKFGGSSHDSKRVHSYNCLSNTSMELNSLIKVQENVNSLGNLEVTINQNQVTTKRKVVSNKCDIDLNLTLGLKSRNGESSCESTRDLEGEDECLSLSLYSQSLAKKARMLKEVDRGGDGGILRASTLDLTI